MSVRMIAKANRKVKYANGKLSNLPFHSMPDGAAVFPLSDGYYVYVSNSEMKSANGGVYGVYFDENGRVVDYKRLLAGTTRNCSGGKMPWNTWVSCEEYGRGQCWQVDPDPDGEHHTEPEMTLLGQEGGNFEAVACDNSNPSNPVFYLTEDAESGALRRYRPLNGTGWDTLHKEGGTFDYLEFIDEQRFRWTTNLNDARNSQQKWFSNVEGVDYFDGKCVEITSCCTCIQIVLTYCYLSLAGKLYFVSKKTHLLYTLDLKSLTYNTTSTELNLFGDGTFSNSPDQIIRGKGGNVLYFTEDGGKTVGVYAIDQNNKRYTMFEAYSSKYIGDETTGLAFSPDGTKMYACFQDCGCENSEDVDFTCGCLLEFSRRDGESFDGSTFSLKFHAAS
jgi:hypothetical protein